MYPWTSFAPRYCGKINRTAPGALEEAYRCLEWGVGNQTEAMAAMAARGVNMIMPYRQSSLK